MAPSTLTQLPLFSSPASLRSLKADYHRLRVGLDFVVDETSHLLPEAEVRSAASRVGFPFVPDRLFDDSARGRLVHQFCLFHTRIRGSSALEHLLGSTSAPLDEEVVEALGRSYPALIRIGKRVLRHGFAATNLITGENGIFLEPAG